LRIGLCHTKPTERGHYLLECCDKGIRRNGDEPVWMEDVEACRKWLHTCDVAMQVCVANHRRANIGHEIYRRFLKDHADALGKRIITIDTGFIKNQSEMEMLQDATDGKHKIVFDVGLRSTYRDVLREIHYEMGYDGLKRRAQYYAAGSPGDRWEKLGIPLCAWGHRGQYILFLGQTVHGASSQHLNIYEWYREAALTIRSVTDRPILFRQHPRNYKRPARRAKDMLQLVNSFRGIPHVEYSTSWLLEEDTARAWCAVVLSSNAGVGTVIQGIPTFTGDENCMAWDVGNHDLKKIESPVCPDRTQWAHDLAYCQWNCEEMRDGLAWKHLRPHAIREVA
jgi:hypothetical protein